MTQSYRIQSIDIMRGLTLFLMLFVNDLYTPGVPKWLVHTAAEEDGMGLADWVFPGFLFIVGLSIPFAFKAREKLGQSNVQLLAHILTRTLSLLIIGVFMVNLDGYNAEATGMNKFLWAILVYASVFLIWNNYPKGSKFKLLFKGMKCVGVLMLITLAVLYRSGTEDSVGWMSTSWWGILGLIGWGYFVAAITYMLLQDRIGALMVVWIGFVVLNILSQLSYTSFLDPLSPVLGVIIDGNVPSIVLSGLAVGVLLKKSNAEYRQFLLTIVLLGITCVVMAFVFRTWFIISKIGGTPSWAMLCNGISILVFALLFYILDVKHLYRWSIPFRPAGQNSLTTYLAPDIIYFIIWGLGLNILIYKQAEITSFAIGGSIVWAFAMIALATLLSRMNIRLKI